MARATLDAINTGALTWPQAVQTGQVDVDHPAKLFELLDLLEGFDPGFNIVTPRGASGAVQKGSSEFPFRPPLEATMATATLSTAGCSTCF